MIKKFVYRMVNNWVLDEKCKNYYKNIRKQYLKNKYILFLFWPWCGWWDKNSKCTYKQIKGILTKSTYILWSTSFITVVRVLSFVSERHSLVFILAIKRLRKIILFIWPRDKICSFKKTIVSEYNLISNSNL